MTIIDSIIKAAAQQYRVRMITDPAEAKRLGCRVGDYIREPIPREFKVLDDWLP